MQSITAGVAWIGSMRDKRIALSLYNASIQTARTVVLRHFPHITKGSLKIIDYDGSITTLGKKDVDDVDAINVDLHITSPKAWLRILVGNDIGFAEAYMLGELQCPNLTDFFRLLLQHPSPPASLLSSITNTASASLHWLTNNSPQALLNAQNHYSLSNDLFASFLDPTMTYSAPIWLPLSDPASSTDTLEAAQRRKLQHNITAARLKPSDHVLEIGTGWGSFAILAASTIGCRITTLTASQEQAELARQRVAAAGLSSLITVLYSDYRALDLSTTNAGQRFDKLISIEMIEHVGPQFLTTYFACVDAYLKLSGGIAVFQCITIPEPRYAAYCKRRDFIQRYIFPGGHLPTVSGLVAAVDKGSEGRLVVEEVRSVGKHYVRALREWRGEFERNWKGMGETALREAQPGMIEEEREVFRRKWVYYFAYCEAGFREKMLGDVCVVVGREGAGELMEGVPF